MAAQDPVGDAMGNQIDGAAESFVNNILTDFRFSVIIELFVQAGDIFYVGGYCRQIVVTRMMVVC